MNFSRTVIAFFALAPFAFPASKEIVELQRDVAMLQDQVRNLQRTLDEKVATLQTLAQQTLDSANRTNTAVAVVETKFNEAMKQQSAAVTVPVANVGQRLDQMSEDFRAVREAVLDMNTRMGKLDAKIADLQNLVSTLNRPPAQPPPGPGSTSPTGGQTAEAAPAGPPPGVQAETTYTNAFRDLNSGKYDLAFQEFNDYLKWFGNTQFAPNAQFYIGDIYYKKEDFTNAIQAYDNVLEHFSENSKTPDAHYMKGMALMKSGKNDAAAREFREVYTRYPDSEVSAKAKARLRDLGLSVGSPANSKSRNKRR